MTHTAELHQILCRLHVDRGSVLFWYVMYFQFCGWRHVLRNSPMPILKRQQNVQRNMA